MFKAKHKEVPEITRKGEKNWYLDVGKLSELANGHKAFLERVTSYFESNHDKSWLYNIKVFTFESKQFPSDPPVPWVGIAFRTADHVKYFSCCADGAENTFVVEVRYNINFIAQMAEML